MYIMYVTHTYLFGFWFTSGWMITIPFLGNKIGTRIRTSHRCCLQNILQYNKKSRDGREREIGNRRDVRAVTPYFRLSIILSRQFSTMLDEFNFLTYRRKRCQFIRFDGCIFHDGVLMTTCLIIDYCERGC